MIDFLSTRVTTNADDAACSRLFAAVIAQAIWDATKAPNAEEKAGTANELTMDPDAFSALRFLFGKRSVFPLYAEFIGADPRDIRRALVEGNPKVQSEIGRRNWRAMRARLRMMNLDIEASFK